MASHDWRQPPDDRFLHLFAASESLSLCAAAICDGPSVEPYDPERPGRRGDHGVYCARCYLAARDGFVIVEDEAACQDERLPTVVHIQPGCCQ